MAAWRSAAPTAATLRVCQMLDISRGTTLSTPLGVSVIACACFIPRARYQPRMDHTVARVWPDTAIRHTQTQQSKKTMVTIDAFCRLAACLRPRGVLRLVPAASPSPPTAVEATYIRTTDTATRETSQGAPVMLPILDGMAIARALRAPLPR